jgi:hypothetical protein
MAIEPLPRTTTLFLFKAFMINRVFLVCDLERLDMMGLSRDTAILRMGEAQAWMQERIHENTNS